MRISRGRGRLPWRIEGLLTSAALASVLGLWVGGVVTTEPATASVPASAESGMLAFTSCRGGAAHVFAVNADGSGLRALTRTRRAAFECAPPYFVNASLIPSGDHVASKSSAEGSFVRFVSLPPPASMT